MHEVPQEIVIPLYAVLAAAGLLLLSIIVVAAVTAVPPRFHWKEGLSVVLGYRFNCTEETEELDGLSGKTGVFYVDVADGNDIEKFQNIIQATSAAEAERLTRRWLAARLNEACCVRGMRS